MTAFTRTNINDSCVNLVQTLHTCSFLVPQSYLLCNRYNLIRVVLQNKSECSIGTKITGTLLQEKMENIRMWCSTGYNVRSNSSISAQIMYLRRPFHGNIQMHTILKLFIIANTLTEDILNKKEKLPAYK